MKLTHPDSKQTVEVKDGDEGTYLAAGWVAKAKPKSKADED